MRLLALDAAAGRCSVALMLDEVISERSLESGKAHSEDLLTLSSALLGEAGVTLKDLDGIASSIGPGAFTGVRVTVSVAQGLAFGAERPVVAVNTLEALALQLLPAHEQVFACLDARMGEVYASCFARDERTGLRLLMKPTVVAPGELALPDGRFAGIGQGLSAYPKLAAALGLHVPEGADGALPHAREIAKLGGLRLRAGGGMDPKELEPLYLRDKVAFTSAERAGR
jgi:tRNA threonylcarbamoyladenosine biosynthesis protein TsaB